MSEPDPNEFGVVHAALRARRVAAEAAQQAQWQDETEYWAGRPLLERRVGWRDAGCPRFLYKYRGAIHHDEGARRASDILLRHQLWLADVSHYEDTQDSRIDYRVTLSGEALREEMEAFMRRIGPANRFKAARLVSDRVIADPMALMKSLNDGAERMLSAWGICSLAANARSIRMWNEYSDAEQGVCFQFMPAEDFAAFGGVQPITYSDEERVIENRLFGDDLVQRRLDLLNTKRMKYRFEDEWRVIEPGRANFPLSFKPAALTAVILGANASKSAPRLTQLLAERQRMTGRAIPVYQAYNDGSVICLRRCLL